MWEERSESRKYVPPHIPTNGGGPSAINGSYHNSGYDPTEDLHAWSIYRQNLNADLSESAIGLNKSHNPHHNNQTGGPSEKPFGNFQLKESTVNNILSHPKYGPSIRNHDPYTYLRFGLPRVKPTANGAQSEIGAVRSGAASAGPHHHQNQRNNLQQNNLRHRITSGDSASGSDDESPYIRRRNNGVASVNNKRIWKSNPDLVRADVAESNFMSGDHAINSHTTKNGHKNKMNGVRPSSKMNGGHHPNGKAVSEIDLRANGTATNGNVANGYGGFGKTSSPSSNMMPNGTTSSTPKSPHLIIRNLYYEMDKTATFKKICGAQRQKLRILDNISFEVKAGEILAIMATNAMEGTAILDVMADRYNKSTCKVRGDMILNGVYMNPKKLSQLVSYVSQETHLCPQMTSRQTLLFTSLVQKAAKRNDFDTKKRTNALLEELGLSEVRHSSVSTLTEAEKRRLLIAVSLLLDTDLLLLDQPVKGMDIFDTFFLVEYLRQWALISGRCVIMTIHPATYEIFTMLSKVALVSTGRILYFGKRKDMLSYFSYIDYPCPAFKNPSDYYLDLVTLDNLSTEAMLESSQRIETLVELYNRRYATTAVSLPGPPSATPPPPKKSGFAIQFLSLWIRALIFSFPYNVIHLFKNLFVSLLLSILTGIIYWHVRVGREQEHLWDRIGLYHALLALSPLPLFLMMISDSHDEKQFILTEVKHAWYSRTSYFFSKFIYSLPQATLCFIAFSLPASSMAGLHNDLSIYLLLLLAYLHAFRIISLFCAWAFHTKSSSSVMFGLIYSLIILASGTTIHYKDLSPLTKWLYNWSIMRWTHEALIGWEFSSNVSLALTTSSWVPSALPYLCSHNPIIQQENAILIKADCGIQSRTNILQWFSYRGGFVDSNLRAFSHPFISAGAVFIIFTILSMIGLIFMSKRKVDVVSKSTSIKSSTSYSGAASELNHVYK